MDRFARDWTQKNRRQISPAAIFESWIFSF
jgi:hypothetical protein